MKHHHRIYASAYRQQYGVILCKKFMSVNMVQKLLQHEPKIQLYSAGFAVHRKFLVNFGLMMRKATFVFILLLTLLTHAFSQKKVQLQKGAGKLIGGTRNGETH
jgi:hypothetical protein